MLSILGNIDPAETMTELQFPNGRILRLPTAMLQEEVRDKSSTGFLTPVPEGVVTVPIIEEQLEVSKRTIPIAQVRLEKSVDTYDVTLNEPLAVRSVRVERVPKGHVVETAPAVRQEGETTVYPILEERLVLTKELVLLEEVRVTNELSEFRDTQVVTLRRERLDVTGEDVVGA